MTDEELRPLVLEAIKTAKCVDQYSSIQEFLDGSLLMKGWDLLDHPSTSR